MARQSRTMWQCRDCKRRMSGPANANETRGCERCGGELRRIVYGPRRSKR